MIAFVGEPGVGVRSCRAALAPFELEPPVPGEPGHGSELVILVADASGDPTAAELEMIPGGVRIAVVLTKIDRYARWPDRAAAWNAVGIGSVFPVDLLERSGPGWEPLLAAVKNPDTVPILTQVAATGPGGVGQPVGVGPPVPTAGPGAARTLYLRSALTQLRVDCHATLTQDLHELRVALAEDPARRSVIDPDRIAAELSDIARRSRERAVDGTAAIARAAGSRVPEDPTRRVHLPAVAEPARLRRNIEDALGVVVAITVGCAVVRMGAGWLEPLTVACLGILAAAVAGAIAIGVRRRLREQRRGRTSALAHIAAAKTAIEQDLAATLVTAETELALAARTEGT